MKNQHMYTTFGKEVKIAMIKRGINNRELSQMIGCSDSTICDILKGRNCCKRRMKELADLFELKEVELP